MIFANRNKLRIYGKFIPINIGMEVYETGAYIGTKEYKENERRTLYVGLDINIVNDGNSYQIISDINIFICHKKNRIAKLKIYQAYINDIEIDLIHDCNIPCIEMHHDETKNVRLYAMLEPEEYESIKYDEIKLEYFDRKNKSHSLHITNISKARCWNIGDIQVTQKRVRIL